MNRLTVSGHAVLRYQERVRPTLDLRGARRELETLLPFGVFGDKPAWKTVDSYESADRWYWLGDDVVLIVRDDVAMTVLIRQLPPTLVTGRRFGRRVVRGAKRARKQRQDGPRGRHERDQRRRPDVEEAV